MDINKKIIDLSNQRGWSIYTLSLEAGLTQSTLNSLLHRGTPPKIDTLKCICDAFGITLSQFFLENEQIEILNPKEKELVSLFRKLPDKKQEALLKLLDK